MVETTPAVDTSPVDGGSEYRLLTLFSRKALGSAQAAQAHELLREEGLRWEYLMGIAGYHGVQPLLYYHLRREGADLVPEAAFAKLRAVVGARSAHSIVLEHELGRLAGTFESEGLPLLAVKGPALAHNVYGSIALRPFVDLDLIVRRGDFERVEALLRREGYDAGPMPTFQKVSYLFIHGQYTFWRRLSDMGSAAAVLDIHTAVMPPGYSYSEDFDDLFARSETRSIAGADTHVLEREDLLQVLCYHGFKNRWDRLKYVCDVAEFLRAYPDLDWEVVHRRADAMHSRRVLWLGLALAQQLLGAPLPGEVARDIRGDRRVQALSMAILERLPKQAHMRVEPYAERVRLNFLAQDSLLGGLRYGAYAAVRRVSRLYIPEND
jgi:hypothetical protein